MFINHEACSKFTVDLPQVSWEIPPAILELEAMNYTTDFPRPTNHTKWVGIVQRGGCSFDQKVLVMQEAGFSSVIVFNQMGDRLDETVRMSAHDLGDFINVFSTFMSRKDGLRLVTKILKETNPIVTISVFKPQWFSKKILLSGLVDMAVLFLLVVFTGTTFMMFGLCINIGHNLAVYGEFLVLETIQEASLLILSETLPSNQPQKLEKITFPSKILTIVDLSNDWKCGGIKGHENCPICIEELEIGHCVRELPCRHTFHSEW